MCVCGHWCYMCMCVRACVYIVQVHVCIAPYNVMNLNSATQIVTCAQVTIHQHLKLLSHILVVTLLRVKMVTSHFLATSDHFQKYILMISTHQDTFLTASIQWTNNFANAKHFLSIWASHLSEYCTFLILNSATSE